MTHLVRILTIGAVVGLAATSFAQTRAYEVRKDGGSKVTFTSEAPLETIDGVTSTLTGTINLDSKDLTKSTATFEMPVATLRTGVDLRDEHLRGENWLNAKMYPTATLQITEIKGPKTIKAKGSTKVKAKGNFTLHGVTKPVTIDGSVHLVPFTETIKGTPGIDGDVVRIAANFKVKLTDFGISVPAIVQLKVSNEIAIATSIRGIAKPEAAAATTPSTPAPAAPAPATPKPATK